MTTVAKFSGSNGAAQREFENLDVFVRISRKDEQLRDPYILHDLCLRQDIDMLFELLETRKYDVNGRNPNGLVPLQVAVVSAEPPFLQDLINYLLYYRADVNARCTPDGNTSLHMAIIYSKLINAEISVPMLLLKGAVPNLRNYADRTPRDYAIANGYEDLAALLDAIEKNPERRSEIDPNDWKSKFGAGERNYSQQLQQAIERGDTAAVADLAHKMNAGGANKTNELLCYHLAVEKSQRNKTGVIESLASSGVDATKVDDKGNTPIHAAIELMDHNNKMVEVIKALLKAGVPKTPKNKENKDALTMATERGYKDVENLLAEPKPKPKPPPPPPSQQQEPPKRRDPPPPPQAEPAPTGRRPIHDILNAKRTSVKQKLQDLERMWTANPYANPNVRSADGVEDTPLHVTVRRDQEELVDFLLSKNAVVNVRNKLGETPLKLAQQSEFGFNMSVFEKLKEANRKQAAEREWARMSQRIAAAARSDHPEYEANRPEIV